MINLGTVRPGRTIYIPFESFASSTGAPITMSGFAVGDIKIYKDGSTTERASTSGFTLLDTDGIDFDGITGIHGFSIDLSDNTTADFYAAGSRYFIVVSTITVDSQTMSFVAAAFRIGYEDAVVDTTIATLSSQTSFTLTTGPAEDDALNGMWAIIHDQASAVQWTWVQIDDYTGSTKTVTLAAGGTFTVAAKDNISIIGPMPLQSLAVGRKLSVGTDNAAQADVAKLGGSAVQQSGGYQKISEGTGTGQVDLTSGRIGLDWGKVSNPTSTVGLPNTTVGTVSLVSVVTTYTGNTPQTGDSFSRLGAPASASVSADVAAVKTDTGNLVTRITSTLFSGITSLAQWLGLLAGKQTGNSTARTELRATGGGSGTFDETTDSQEAIRDRGDAAWITGSAGDPWATALPGAYGAGTAGKIIGDNINATVGSRATPAQVAAELATYDAPTNAEMVARTLATADYATSANQSVIITDTNELQSDWTDGGRLDLIIDAIKAKSDGLPADPADASDIAALFSTVNSTLGTIAGFIDTEVATLVTNVASILAIVGTTGAVLSAAERTAIANALMDLANGIETGITPRQAMRLGVAADSGKVSGAATTTVRIRDAADTKDRITATVDADGNRTAVTRDLT